MITIDQYTGLITSEHADKPDFLATVSGLCQPLVDSANAALSLSAWFDLDNAHGAALDVLGKWIGISRTVRVQITGVYFSFDSTGVGFDEGIWQGPYDPSSGLVSLPDSFYLILLRAKILNNQWRGSIADAYTLMNLAFAPYGFQLFIQDNCDMTMYEGLVGSVPPPPIVTALFNQGYLDVKPAGVKIINYVTQSQPGPIFAFDVENEYFAGFDFGAFANFT